MALANPSHGALAGVRPPSTLPAHVSTTTPANNAGACLRGDATIAQAPIAEATHHCETPAPPGDVRTARKLVTNTSSIAAAWRVCRPMESPLEEFVEGPGTGRSLVAGVPRR